jgi:hypothetical protein
MKVINSIKSIFMKYINKKSTGLLYALIIGIGIGFVACDADSEDEVIPKTLDEYKTELSDLITSEKAIVQKCIVGYNKGDFKDGTLFTDYTYNYMAALVEAEKILAKPDLTIANVMTANKLISPSGKLFNDNLFISDRRPLNNLIGVCDTLYVHTPEGNQPGMAPAEARSQFKSDISAAKTVRDRSSTIERQVTEAVEELTKDLATFKMAIIK